MKIVHFVHKLFLWMMLFGVQIICHAQSLPKNMVIDWPMQTIKIVVPWPAGGQPDSIARNIGNLISKDLGANIIVENKPGAASNIGASFGAKSLPDGYTLLVVTSTNAANMGLYKNPGYDLLKDFTPITTLGETATVIAVSPTLPVNTLDDLIKYAQKNPGDVAYGSPGIGSPGHLAAEQLQSMGKIKLRHIPYQGAPQAIQDLIGGNIQVAFVNVTVAQNFVESGKLKILAVTTKRRWPLLPNIPTVEEAGIKGYEWSSWIGLVAPTNTPKEIIEKLNKTIINAASTKAAISSVRQMGIEPSFASPDDFGVRMSSDVSRYGLFIRKSGVTID